MSKKRQGRCGVGPRLPFLLISPWAKSDYLDSTFIDRESPASWPLA